MVWSNVQVERPSWSTSGGQSGGGSRGATAWAGAVEVGVWVRCFVIAAQDAKDVHERHLRRSQSSQPYPELVA